MAEMSRDLIETGLPDWQWHPARIGRQLRQAETCGVVAELDGGRAGFALMSFGRTDVQLILLAVRPTQRRAGIGRGLVEWLTASARVAGLFRVNLEVRDVNREARAFYAALGFEQTAQLPGYYCGREAAVRLSADLALA
ncbi:MAG: GNAT family N-acetyltransferase [Gammaproteobacteria bacterium]|nr:GNAT family N-acetyltransferase [Gammaproteobacteria bacterium]